jgi:hypothetical protein
MNMLSRDDAIGLQPEYGKGAAWTRGIVSPLRTWQSALGRSPGSVIPSTSVMGHLLAFRI